MKNKKELSIGGQIFLGKIVVGICWMAAGISGYFGGVISSALQIIFLLGAIIPMILLFRSKKEESDEMADVNLTQAKAQTGDLMHIVLCMAAVIVPLLEFFPGSTDWNWPRIMGWSFFILIGIQNLITGFVFKMLEE